MANTTVASELRVKNFIKEFFKEYIRKSRFSRYTGVGVNNVITIKEGRKQIEIPLVTRLKGAGTTGSNTLRGNGEKIGNYGQTLTPTYKRHAVEFTREELEKPAIDLMQAARPLLMNWAMEKTRDEIIKSMAAMHNGTAYFEIQAVTEAQADSWSAANDDRILYGAVKSNHSGDHSADLAKLDSSADKLVRGVVSVAKRIAQTADPHITPIRDEDDEEWFIIFADPFAFRDLKADLGTSHQNAMPRSKEGNPIWKGGDLTYDGVIIRQVPEIDTLVTETDGTLSTINLLTGGDSSARVGPCFLCGTQAIGFGLGQRPRIVIDRDYDYGFQPGVAVELKHHIQKMFFDANATGVSSQDVQTGMVTIYTYAAVDA